jgi:hypothetical protein
MVRTTSSSRAPGTRSRKEGPAGSRVRKAMQGKEPCLKAKAKAKAKAEAKAKAKAKAVGKGKAIGDRKKVAKKPGIMEKSDDDLNGQDVMVGLAPGGSTAPNLNGQDVMVCWAGGGSTAPAPKTKRRASSKGHRGDNILNVLQAQDKVVAHVRKLGRFQAGKVMLETERAFPMDFEPPAWAERIGRFVQPALLQLAPTNIVINTWSDCVRAQMQSLYR